MFHWDMSVECKNNNFCLLFLIENHICKSVHSKTVQCVLKKNQKITNRTCPLRGEVLLSANDKRPFGDCACDIWPSGDAFKTDSGLTGDDYI